MPVNKQMKGRVFFVPFYASLFVFFLIDFLEFWSPFSYVGEVSSYYLMFFIFYFSIFLFLIPYRNITFFQYSMQSSVALVKKIAPRLIAFSFLGVLFVIIDRVFIQGVDYSHGIAAARTGWQQATESRVGVSSILSVVGNLLYPLVYVASILIMVYYELIPKVKRLIFGVLFIIVSFSLIIGGKTEILVLLSLVFASTVTRKVLGISYFPRVSKKIIILSGFVLGVFIIFIFIIRMEGSAVGFQEYIKSLVIRHEGMLVNSIDTTTSKFMLAFYGVIIYFIHVKWIFVNIINNPDSIYGNAFFNQIMYIFSTRLGLDFSSIGYYLDWTHSGRWLSFIGRVWHDFGLWGVFIVSWISSIFLFVLNGLMLKLNNIKSRGLGVSIILVYTSCIAFFIMSPFSPLFSVVSFIYMFFGLIGLILIFVFLKYSLTSSIKKK